MEHYLKQLSSTISSAMQGADEKAVTTKRYKDITKMIMVRRHGSQVFIILPCVSSVCAAQESCQRGDGLQVDMEFVAVSSASMMLTVLVPGVVPEYRSSAPY